MFDTQMLQISTVFCSFSLSLSKVSNKDINRTSIDVSKVSFEQTQCVF